jgi:hypothetical protein
LPRNFTHLASKSFTARSVCHVHSCTHTLELRQKQNAESPPLPRAPDPTKSPNHQLITFGSGALGSPPMRRTKELPCTVLLLQLTCSRYCVL